MGESKVMVRSVAKVGTAPPQNRGRRRPASNRHGEGAVLTGMGVTARREGEGSGYYHCERGRRVLFSAEFGVESDTSF